MSTLLLTRIVPSALNPRKHFDEDALRELADSILEHGVKQALLVRPTENDQYEIIMGERRWRAAGYAGLEEIPVTIEEMDDATAKALMLVENMQRADLSAMEEAAGFQELQKLSGKSVVDIAKSIAKSKEYIYARLKLLDAAEVTQQALAQGVISPAHAVILARRSEREQQTLINNIAEQDLSVADLAKHVARSFVDLRLAPFDRTIAFKAAPACVECPKSSACNPEILEETKSAEMPSGDVNACSDRFCYEDKVRAHFGKLLKTQQKALKLKEPILLVTFEDVPAVDMGGLLPLNQWEHVTVEAKNACGKQRAALVVGSETWDKHRELIGTVVLACADRKCPVHGDIEHRPAPDAKAIKQREKEARTAIVLKENERNSEIASILSAIPAGKEWLFALDVVPFGAPGLDEMARARGLSDQLSINKWLRQQTPISAARFFVEYWIRESASSMNRAYQVIDALHTDAKPAAKSAKPIKSAKKKPAPAKTAKKKGGKK